MAAKMVSCPPAMMRQKMHRPTWSVPRIYPSCPAGSRAWDKLVE